jgi:hypothetical protein
MTNAIEVNCATGEVTERPLTAEEIAQREADAVAFAEEKAAKEAADVANAAAKHSAQEKLKALGLSDIEVAAITNI